MGSMMKSEVANRAIELCNEMIESPLNSNSVNDLNVSKTLIESLININAETRECCTQVLSKLEKDLQAVKEKTEQKELINSENFKANVKKLQEEKEQQEIKLKKGRSVLEEITNKKDNILKDSNVLNKKKENLEKKESDNVVRNQATFALLTSTFNIRWDYQSQKNEVKGCISTKNDLVPFSLNKDQHDSHYTANFLWDLLELS